MIAPQGKDITPIPLVDLKAAHAEVAEEVSRGLADVIARTAFIDGPEVAEFEAAYALFTGVSQVIGVANGTDALEIALRVLNLHPGDEVIMPANTYIATAEAVVRAGGVPVYGGHHAGTPVRADAGYGGHPERRRTQWIVSPRRRRPSPGRHPGRPSGRVLVKSRWNELLSRQEPRCLRRRRRRPDR